MQAAVMQRAVAAAMSTVSELGLEVDDAVVLSDSNRLVVRLTPCDVVARVAVAPPEYRERLATEVEVVRRLGAQDVPVAGLDPRVPPRVYERDGFAITIWAHFEPVPRVPAPAAYADALVQLHAGLRHIDGVTAHFIDRITVTQHDVASRAVTPDLADLDRDLLASVLRDLRASVVGRHASEQVLHGEPHPWNVLDTAGGPLFIDFENCVRGPVEYDLAWVPKEVSDRYEGADQELVDDCRGLVLAIIAMHRWSHDDQHPSGRESGVAFLGALREGPPWRPLDTV
jgi:hypothetical protein